MIRISRVLCKNLALFGLFLTCFGGVLVLLCKKRAGWGCACVFVCEVRSLARVSLFVATRGPPYLTSQHFMGCQAACSLQKPQLISAFVFGSKYTCVDDACAIILALEATQLCAVCMYVSLCSEWWVWQLTKRASWEVRLSSGLVCRRCGVCVHLFTRKCVIGWEYVSENRIYDSSGIVCFVLFSRI